ncbi:MAG: protein kinase, partial [Myxococcota bacterium]
ITPPLDQGAQVGPYEVVGHIATGGMGEVYLARKKGIGGFERTVVLKVMLPHLAQDERFSRMFVDEARIASGLTHPNIVQVYDLGSSAEGGLYLAMEHLQGVSAIACLKRCAQDAIWVPEAIAARIVCDAATGLTYAHAATGEDGQQLGLVHRDISPENLFLTYAGPTKLLDFGVAKVRDRLAETQAGEFKGKVGYMAPEIIRGEEPDGRADLFSLGVVFFELLTNRRLFHASVPATALHRVLSASVPDVRTLREGVSPVVASLVASMLNRNPRKRTSSAEEVAERLETWLNGREGTHRHVSRWLQARFADAHALSGRIASAVERTGHIDPNHLQRARQLNGEALDDTVVRELSESERHSPVLEPVAFDGLPPDDDGWIRRETWSRRFWALTVLALGAGLLWWVVQRPPGGREPAWAGYVKTQVVHEGYAGTVMTASARGDGRDVIVIAEPSTPHTADALRLLEQTRRGLLELDDPGLPVPTEVGIYQGQPFSAFASMEGRSLATLVDQEFVARRRGVMLARSIADIMAAAERGKLVHGWLSPELVWITPKDQVRILGFRGPRAFARSPEQTATVGPLAPELTDGTPPGPAADQYALAAMLSTLLRKVDQTSSVYAASVLARAMAVEPTRRYATTGAFVKALDRKLRKRGRRRRRR